jgi:hypothetical protein
MLGLLGLLLLLLLLGLSTHHDDWVDHSSAQTYARFQKERLEAFSDGIFAISVTLVAVNMRPPEFEGEDFNLFLALTAMWQQFYSQILSFLVCVSMSERVLVERERERETERQRYL